MDPTQIYLVPALCVLVPTLLGILMLIVIWHARGRTT
jgi:hypothetical protein